MLNLRTFIPQKDVRKLIFSYLNKLDVKMIFAAHNKEKEKLLEDDDNLCDECAEYGYTELMLWAYELGSDWSKTTMEKAAARGHLQTMQVLAARGCDFDEKAMSYAARGGHGKVVKWLRQNGCMWDEVAFASAAEGGHHELLIWMRDNGCPWDARSDFSPFFY